MPQLASYQRVSGWVAPGGSLLIVGHLNNPDTTGHGHDQGHHGHGHHGQRHHPPEEASVTAAGITAGLDHSRWDVVTAEEHTRTLTNRGAQAVQLHDVVVCATRR